jgi:hypothetical protein
MSSSDKQLQANQLLLEADQQKACMAKVISKTNNLSYRETCGM